MTPSPMHLAEAVKHVGSVVLTNPANDMVQLGIHMAMGMRSCVSTDAVARTWGEALLTGACWLASNIDDEACDGMRVIMDAQAVAGWVLYTEATPS